MNLQNKTIVVTGVASGIGAEVARLARFHGAKVIGVDRMPVQMTLHGFHQADLGDPVSIDALVKALPDHIDALANIAGVPGTAPLDVVARVNYLGLRHLTQGCCHASFLAVPSSMSPRSWAPNGRSVWSCTSSWRQLTASTAAARGWRRIR